MKTVVLIFSIILSLLGILVGQFAYPFMASLFDGMPILFAAIIGVLIVIVLSVIVSVATKDKFYRASIIVPCIISVIATFFILLARFDYNNYYRNGYIFNNGELKNNIGVTIVDSPIGPYWFMGIDEYGNDVLVNMGYNDDWVHRRDNDRKYDYEIKWYDLSGNYLGYKDFTKYYDEDDEKLTPGSWYSDYDDAKYIAEEWADIELYKRIG